MKFLKIEPKDFLNQYFYKQDFLNSNFLEFKNALQTYMQNLQKCQNHNEDTFVADALKPFFESLGYEVRTKHKIKGKSEIDLSLIVNSKVEVLIEAKRSNDADFFRPNNINCKALHEVILYYFKERELNTSIKHIILSDFYNFYIFESKEFERLFYQNKFFKELYKDFIAKDSTLKGNTQDFYSEAKNIIESSKYLDSVSLNTPPQSLKACLLI